MLMAESRLIYASITRECILKENMKLSNSIATVKGVGDKTAKLFGQLGIETVSDLVNFMPRRYEDYSNIQEIRLVKPGEITVKAQISSVRSRYSKRGLHVTEAVIDDGSGKLSAVWFNQPYRAAALKSNEEYYLSGSLEFARRRFTLMNPSVELASDFPAHTARIIPIYRQTRGLTSTAIRRAVRGVLKSLPRIPETLPDTAVKQAGLVSRDQALREVHFPSSAQKLEDARNRLAWEETFALSIVGALARKQLHGLPAANVTFNESVTKQLVAELPFKLTPGQKRSAWDILQDLQSSKPMNRLLQGDVGSGKTVVAALAALNVSLSGGQVAFVAPTDLLAKQHAQTLESILAPYKLTVGLLTASQTARGKTELKKRLKDGDIDILVGTHAILQPSVVFKKLELAVIDEQHRFGVDQRRQLLGRTPVPHMLTMSATPIPRTLALTLYGELDISVIAEMPANRKPTKTKLWAANNRSGLYKQVASLLSKGGQAFVVAPKIDTDELGPTRSVADLDNELSKLLKGYSQAVVHGRLKSDERDKIMLKFVNGELDVLIATTVVEVGVDVPGASIMVIEGAERFGLAQIHQLRGRVGRRGQQAFCYLIPSSGDSPSRRLTELEKSHNGFELAELDLKLRGPGEIYGLRQHGQLDLKFAPISDSRSLKLIKELATELVQEPKKLLEYEELYQRVMRLSAITRLN